MGFNFTPEQQKINDDFNKRIADWASKNPDAWAKAQSVKNSGDINKLTQEEWASFLYGPSGQSLRWAASIGVPNAQWFVDFFQPILTQYEAAQRAAAKEKATAKNRYGYEDTLLTRKAASVSSEDTVAGKPKPKTLLGY